jgi:hypothetical protein
VLLTAASHLLPGKYPAHHKELLVLVVAYYIVSAGAFLFMWVFGKDAFAHFRESAVESTPPMCMQLHFPRYSHNFTIKVLSRDRYEALQLECNCSKEFHAVCCLGTCLGNCACCTLPSSC